jgi:SWI/SNF-related matrix-associated actin-dependent regulator 1 of chromatin subfamily A
MKLLKRHNTYYLETQYNEYQAHSDVIKKNFRWNKDEKRWETGYFNNVFDFIMAIRQQNIPCAVYIPELTLWRKLESISAKNMPSDNFMAYMDKLFTSDETINYKGYQVAAAEYLLTAKKAILADDMGLGKTAETILALNILHRDKKLASGDNIVIACPAHLKHNWLNEIRNFYKPNGGLTVIVYGKKQKEEIISSSLNDHITIHIINYDILEKNLVHLEGLAPKVIVADESHFAKSANAKRTKALQNLIASVKPEYVWLLSGTPATATAMDMYPQLQMIDHPIAQNWWFYAHRYADAEQVSIKGRKVWKFGFSNTNELKQILTMTAMLRRTKDKVLKQLPPKNRQVIALDPADVHEILIREKEILKAHSVDIKDLELPELIKFPVNALSSIRQELALKKIPAIVAMAQDILQTEDKLVIFAWHHTVINELQIALEKVLPRNSVVQITGNETQEKKANIIFNFQNKDNPKVIIGSISAVATGVTLTKASTCIFAELDWIPANIMQAEDRLHRLGQKSVVDIYYIVFDMSIESTIAKKMYRRKEDINSLLSLSA